MDGGNALPDVQLCTGRSKVDEQVLCILWKTSCVVDDDILIGQCWESVFHVFCLSFSKKAPEERGKWPITESAKRC